MLNLHDVNLRNAVRIAEMFDPRPKSLTEGTVLELLEEGGDDILEAMTMAEIEASEYGTFSLDGNDMLLEAINTTRNRVTQTMRAFIRALSQKLNGTGITAGNDSAGDADDGTKSIGGANVGRVRKISGLAVLPAIIPLSDGQTVTVMFHSPSGDQARIAPTDTLVAFQFLLNKKDVTHVVAPMGGQAMSLSQVTMVLSNLIEKNTQKFQKAQKRQQRMKSDLASVLSDNTDASNKVVQLQQVLDTATTSAGSLQNQLQALLVSIDQQQDENTDLENKIAALQSNPRHTGDPEPQPDPSPAPVPDPEPEPIPTPEPELTGPTAIAAKRLGDQIGWAYDLVLAWAETRDLNADQLNEAASYVAQHATPEYLASVQASMIKGGIIPLVESDPVPEPQPSPEPEPEPILSEADQAAQQAINYLNQVISLQSSDMAEIRDARGKTRAAIGTITDAGKYDENEALANQAAQHLSDLLVAIQRADSGAVA